MEPYSEDQLIAELRALRPAPRPAFAAELDERAAAGFPRRSATGSARFAEAKARLLSLPRRRILFTSGATALATVAAVTAIVLVNQPGSGPSSAERFSESNGLLSAEPSRQSRGAEETEVEATGFSKELPSASSASGGAAATAFSHRDVEHNAEILLGADPADVSDDAARVFETVHAYDGIVMRSSTQEGAAGEAGAEFELLIPSGKLSDALAAFSAIDEVRSRHEATADITAPTVSLGELLQGSKARIDGLLAQLADVETTEEREAVEAELLHERRHAASLRARLANLHRRANFARISLRIETGTDAGSATAGGWGIDEALHDAGHILAVAAAVTLVGLAIVGPVALIALLTWLAHRTWVRRGRKRVLS
jgi:hypothetical protein